jgi:RNA polymerase sigma factor (sigma-70 family)
VQNGWADDALLRGLRARNPRALEALIARYSREVAYFVRMVLDGVGTAQDAEECVNDLFITAWEDIEAFDPTRGALRTWLTMRAKYVALDRRRQIQRRQSLAAMVSSDGHLLVKDRDGRPEMVGLSNLPSEESLEGLLERREQQEQLRRVMEHLPELDRLLVYLRYFRLASTEEIAARTGLTRRAIDTRLWRARKTLREALEALEERAYGHV